MKKNELARKEIEERYRLLADNVTDIIWILDMNLTFTYISPSVTRIQGFSVEEALADTLENNLTPASYVRAMEVFAEEIAIENQDDNDLDRTRLLEVEQYCKDGSTIWVEVKMKFLRDPEGVAVGILGVSRDITERKSAGREREELILKLQEALKKVETLSGMLPLCSSCKKIRNDKGSWQHLELYIEDHSNAEFSHGVCPECARELYPDCFNDEQ